MMMMKRMIFLHQQPMIRLKYPKNQNLNPNQSKTLKKNLKSLYRKLLKQNNRKQKLNRK